MKQAEHTNKVAALHGEPETQDTSLLQYHTEDDLEEGLLHLYGRKTIRAGVALLVEKHFLSLHQNPNEQYRFDRTHYFLFHPEKVQEDIGLDSHQVKLPHRSGKTAACTDNTSSDTPQDETLVNSHQAKLPHRSGKTAFRSGKNAAPITEITPETTEKDQEKPLCQFPEQQTAPGDDEHSPCTPEELVELYNAVIPEGHPRITMLTEERRKKAMAYLRQFPERDFWAHVFGEIAKCPILQGKRPTPGHENFIARFDWFFQKGSKDQIENCIKAHEGRYRDRSAPQPIKRGLVL